MMPSGPPYSGWSCGTSVRPATVSTTGTPCASAKASAAGRLRSSAHLRRARERALRASQGLGGAGEVVAVGALPRNAVHSLLEHGQREVELVDLCVLWHGEYDGPAVGRIGEHPSHLGKGREQLVGRVIRSK